MLAQHLQPSRSAGLLDCHRHPITDRVTIKLTTNFVNGHDPYAYLKDVLTRLPMHKASGIDELLPHHWQHGAI